MTEHLTPYEGRKAPAAEPTAPADPRGALLRSSGVPGAGEHSQPSAAEPDPGRPRPPEAVPPLPAAGPAGPPDGEERRTGRPRPPGAGPV
ncbi:hypothetical protein RMO59_29225, partial [Streptomyces alfalfae]